MKVVQHLDEFILRDFVDSHPAGNIFHTPEMFRVFARTKSHTPTLWVVVDNQQCPLALLLPVQVTLAGGLLHRLISRAIVVYGGIVCAPGPQGQAALNMLLETYQHTTRRAVLFIKLRNLSDVTELQPVLHQHGFVYEAHLNYLINLARPVEDLLQSIGKRTRKKIRQGLKSQEVQLSEVTTRSELGVSMKPCKKLMIMPRCL